MMMEFTLLTLSITFGILLASAIALAIVLQPRVWKWYTNTVYKLMLATMEESEEEKED